MQIQKIQSSEPSFGGIRIEEGLLDNKKRKAVFDYIYGELNKIDSSDRTTSSFFAKLFSKKGSVKQTKKRSYVDRADSFGEDVLFTKSRERLEAVRVDIVRKKDLIKPVDYSHLNYRFCHVGTYSIYEKFDIQHFKDKYKPIDFIRHKLMRFVEDVLNI